ncbi:MAG: primosomal protein N' [Saprospiraceae bacterium]|nr:primosomal protein N' [Saprospiraceae bacterium]
MRFARVIIPISIDGSFTYRIPEEFNERVVPGIRVEVEFGKKRHYAGLVQKIEENEYYPDAKQILDILDQKPIVSNEQLRLWDWISEYYVCSLGEVMSAALPNAFRLASETRILKAADIDYTLLNLSPEEFLVLEALDLRHELNLSDIYIILQKKRILKLIKDLNQKGYIIIKEQLDNQEDPVKLRWIKLADKYTKDQNSLNEALVSVQKSEYQTRFLLCYLAEKKDYGWIKSNEISKLSGSDGTITKALVKKGIFIEVFMDKYKIPDIKPVGLKLELSTPQKKAKEELLDVLRSKGIALLKGVTGSGKTQVYLDIIKDYIAEGKQILYMVPEIALTSQLVNRVKQYYPEQTLEYHSGLSNRDRLSVWNQCLEGHPLIIGARSALFLPFSNLGLVIVDEEHDPSYKQNEPSPRYNARDSAMMLTQYYAAHLILGSATPSLESYQLSLQDRIGMVRLDERFGEGQLPEIKIISLKEARKKAQLRGNFSEELISEMTKQLEGGQQILVFRNRRGYSPLLQCSSCQWESTCQQCDLNLTFHKYQQLLKCHLCGLTQSLPSHCPECGKENLKLMGFGTEKIEEELREIFPDKIIARFDQESARTRSRQIQIMEDFQNKEIDILVGTQMIAKGLDFDHVGLVVIVQADQILHFPDFRAHERAFQLMTQVSGRSGRRNLKGKVLIQAYRTDHPILKDVMEQEFTGMSEREMKERAYFHYPPFVKLIRIVVKHVKLQITENVSETLARRLRNKLGNRILGPAEPTISKVKGAYAREIFIKIERNQEKLKEVKSLLKNLIHELKREEGNYIRFIIDVDPY